MSHVFFEDYARRITEGGYESGYERCELPDTEGWAWLWGFGFGVGFKGEDFRVPLDAKP